jgi:hypothetical protein
MCNEEIGAEFIVKNREIAGIYNTPFRVMMNVRG